LPWSKLANLDLNRNKIAIRRHRITERMLIRHLHEMVEDGILLRHEKTVLPHVTYSISPYGMTLAPVLEKICGWERKHQARAQLTHVLEFHRKLECERASRPLLRSRERIQA